MINARCPPWPAAIRSDLARAVSKTGTVHRPTTTTALSNHRVCHETRIRDPRRGDRKSTRLNSSHLGISYAVFCLKKKKKTHHKTAQNPTFIATYGRGLLVQLE